MTRPIPLYTIRLDDGRYVEYVRRCGSWIEHVAFGAPSAYSYHIARAVRRALARVGIRACVNLQRQEG